MSLVADYSDSSESDDSSKKSENEEINGPPPPEKVSPKLPSASQALGNAGAKKTGEVFSNPFLEAELHKTASLERHVKMVNNDTHLQLKNGRKICWNFRKGRCRFGTSCQYAHDSDLAMTETIAPKNSFEAPVQAVQAVKDSGKSNSRKRPGLGDGLEPGKRVMKSYQQQHVSSRR
ncbi:uncharacterized protein LOC117891362 [Drosophila subobscura]|uniref:uncharacterized protein LOC117891362 n=1 Tax=Drosophila subobscura TaxID=7241 RepID=UPI00155A3EBB|nr:uncharacterized protein LOC117891362 [Drosophila subobscura]